MNSVLVCGPLPFERAEHLAHDTARLPTKFSYRFSIECDEILIVTTLLVLEEAVVDSTPLCVEPARSDEVTVESRADSRMLDDRLRTLPRRTPRLRRLCQAGTG